MAMVNVLAALLNEYANQPERSIANFAEDLRASASPSVSTGTRKLEFARQQLRTLLECAAKPSIRSHSDLHHRLLSLAPLLTFGEAPLLGELHAHFARGLDLASFDAIGRPGTEVDDIEALVSLVDEFPRGRTETEKGTGATAATSSSASASKPSFVPSPLGTAIRDYFFHSTDLVQQCFTYLQQAASGDRKESPAPAPSGKKKRARESDDIENSLSTLVARPALPFVLRLLTSFSYGHAPTQALAASKSSALRILQQLEGMASTSRVGPLAESLLQALMINNESVGQAVAELRGQQKKQKKQRALDQRAKMLKRMGFSGGAGKEKKSGGGSGVAAAIPSAFASGMESLNDSGHAIKCLVCMEGYEFQPSHTMGVYVYQHQAVLSHPPVGDDDSSGGGGEEDDGSAGVTTVTHFNLIHHRCHSEACKADRRLKPPKSEWEGATIRNQHTLCNNLFPLFPPPASVIAGVEKGSSSGHSASSSSAAASSSSAGSSATSALMNPASPLWDASDIDSSFETYNALVESYWQQCSFHHCFVHARVELALEDTRTLLSRFAMQESFSALAKGGGKESNIQFIPYVSETHTDPIRHALMKSALRMFRMLMTVLFVSRACVLSVGTTDDLKLW